MNANAATNHELSETLKEQFESANKCIAQLEKDLGDYESKTAMIAKIIDYFTFKVKDDGKCYVEDFAIDFAKFLLA